MDGLGATGRGPRRRRPARRGPEAAVPPRPCLRDLARRPEGLDKHRPEAPVRAVGIGNGG